MSHSLYTIGHSATQFPAFLAMLRRSEVNLLVDVRSKPQSLRFPHFDQVELERAVRVEGIDYVFLGEELGGRPEDPKAYGSDGIVDYEARRKSYAFRAGIGRVLQELAKNDLVLMCSEEDPLNCHRFLMISPELVALGLEPRHIQKVGLTESPRDAEAGLLQTQKGGAIP